MVTDGQTELLQAITRIPSGLFVLTAAHDDYRSGVLARWVQPCSISPPMVMVALAMGQPVEPLLRDSRAFALCQIGDDDRFLERKFAAAPERGEDPFVSLDIDIAPSGSPIIRRAMGYLDCELVRHVDLESDHRLYVGLVHSGALMMDGAPAVVVGPNGRPSR